MKLFSFPDLPNARVETGHRRDFLWVVFQLLLLSSFVFLFRIEDKQGLPVLLAVSVPLFIFHSFIPVRFRPLVLLLAFGVTCTWSLGFVTGGVILFVSSVIFVIAELRVRLMLRLMLISVIAGGMIVLRNEWFFAPRAIIAVPYIASLFVFRLVLFLNEKRKAKEPAPLLQRLNYFFLLPNLVFLLFPVIDYNVFISSYYSKRAIDIYRKGLYRITTGVVLLMAHRVIYTWFAMPQQQVVDFTSLLKYNFVSYLLIIQIVGTFQVCVGWVTLFGYDLPPLFENFFLANGFSDLWRRINHYWRDFIIRIFYFPLFFRIRKMGQYKAMIIAGLTAFFCSWMMHSQQLYWITGKFSFSANDGLYWMTMGVCITADGIYQYRTMGRNKKYSVTASVLLNGLRITGIFLFASFLWTLWNADTVGSWLFMAKHAAAAGMHGATTLFWVLPAAILLSGIYVVLFQKVSFTERERFRRVVFPFFANFLFAGLIAFQFIANHQPAASAVSKFSDRISETRVNDADQEIVDLGYYDQMMETGGISRSGAQFRLFGDLTWGNASGATHRTGDILLRVFNPNARVMHHGYHLYINSMGLRDQEYTMDKPANTLRWAFVGGSYVLGPGVEKEQTFEAIVEQQLNDSLQKAGSGGLQILNFSNGGYLLPQAVELCNTKVFKTHPDAVFYFVHPGEMSFVTKNISRLLAFGVDLHKYPEIQKVIDQAGLKQSQSRLEMMARMQPYEEELVRWGYRSITDSCRAHHATPVWVFLPTTTDGDTRAEFLTVSKIAAEYGFVILDLSNVYGGYKASTVQNSEDDTHPNALGHRLIAAKLEYEIRKKILIAAMQDQQKHSPM